MSNFLNYDLGGKNYWKTHNLLKGVKLNFKNYFSVFSESVVH
jgi:hypothetical protein